jgi:hypothetical protein
MLIDANRRRVEQYWFWIILFFQPFGAWAYFFLYKVKDFRGGSGRLSSLFQWRPSLQELRHRAEQSPTAANRLDLGERLVETGAFAEALPHLEAMLAHEAEHCRSLFLLAQCHRALGHPEQALPLLQKIITRHPSWADYEAWHTVIQVCQETGDQAGALARCRELARVAPRLEHKCLLAEHLLETGEKVEARKIVQQGLEDYRYLTGLSRRHDRRWVGRAKQLLKQME